MNKSNYKINSKIVLSKTEFDLYGNQQTRILEDQATFCIGHPTKAVFNQSLPFGHDVNMAIKSVKRLMGWKKWIPIVFDPYQELCLVPLGGTGNIHTIWVNPYKVLFTEDEKNGSTIHFKSAHSISVKYSAKTVNNQCQKGIQAVNVMLENALNETILERKIIPRNKDGSYNFDILQGDKQENDQEND